MAGLFGMLVPPSRRASIRVPGGVLLGLVSALVAGTLAMIQVERSANRLWGLREDRPTGPKIGRALMLADSRVRVLRVEAIVGAVRRHAAGRHQSDDITLLCLARPA